MRQQLEGLEHKAEHLAAQAGTAIFVEAEKRLTEQAHFAVAGLVEAGQQTQQSGFARARGADDGDGLAFGNGEVDIIKDDQAAGSVLNDLAEAARLDRDFPVRNHLCQSAGFL